MPYSFPPPEQAQVIELREQALVSGNYGPMHSYIAERLLGPSLSDPELFKTYLWFKGAERANPGIGPFSGIIRGYTDREGELHFGAPFGRVRIQETSNAIAEAAFTTLSATWDAPSIVTISDNDARRTGDVLFLSVQTDSAFTINSAWSGALLVPIFGSDESFRLINGAREDQNLVPNSLDDYRNLIYSDESWDAALIGGVRGGLYQLENDPYSLVDDAITGALAAGPDTVINLDVGRITRIERIVAGKVAEQGFSHVLPYADRATDQVRSGYLGVFSFLDCVPAFEAVFDEGIPNQCWAKTGGFFRPLGITGQMVNASYATPEEMLTLARSAGPDQLDARQALEGLSPFLLKGGISPTPPPGLGQLTVRYLEDRAQALAARLVYDGARLAFSPGTEAGDGSFPRTVVFVDVRDGLYMSIDNSILPSLNTPEVRFGTNSVDTMAGAGGDDALYGRDGADQLTGNAGNDYFEGGAGNDSYLVGAGADQLFDSDATGSITFNGVALTGGPRIGSDAWRSADSRFRYIRFRDAQGGQNLRVSDGTNSDSVDILGFNFAVATSLGISLADIANSVPTTATIAPEDLTPAGLRDLYDPSSPNSDLIRSGLMHDTINSAGGDDVIFANAANDRIDGGPGNDTVFGEADRDYIRGGVASSASPAAIADDSDTLVGGAGIDNLYGGIGNDFLYAGEREDDINAPGTGAQGDWLNGGRQDDVLYGSVARDFLNGDAGKDLIFGGSSDDVLLGDGAYDTFLVGTTQTISPGNTTALWHDWVTATSMWRTRTATQAGQSFNVVFTPDSHFEWSVSFAGDDFTFTPVVNRPGFLVRTAPADGDNDLLRGGAGNDYLLGQTGSDRLYGDDGDDRLIGDDVVTLPSGQLPGADTLYGGAGNDRLLANQGNDTLYGEEGADVLLGDDATDMTGGADRLFGGPGADELMGFAGNDELFGQEGNDSVLVGGAGDDQVYGGPGDDTLQGDGPGAVGNDILRGEDGDDLLFGDGGADELRGGRGNDTLNGDDGDDLLVGGKGTDTLNGGAGLDRFVFNYADDVDRTNLTTISDSGSSNRVVFTGRILPQRVNLTVDGSDLLVTYSSADRFKILGGAGGNVIGSYEFPDGRIVTHAELLDFSRSPPELRAIRALGEPSEFGDYLLGTSGNDVLDLLGGNDEAYGLDGNDTIDGGAGVDIIDGVAGNDTLRGGNGNDLLWGSEGDDTLEGGQGMDQLRGGIGADVLDGGTESDMLDGFDGDDTLIGGAGIDVLRGGAGSDLLQGGAGSDRYVFEPGDDPTAAVMPGTRIEDADFSESNTLRFEGGIAVDNLSLQLGADQFVTLQVTYTVDSVPHVVRVKCGSGGVVLNRFEFSDGTIFTFQQMLDRQGLGSPTNSASCPQAILPDPIFKNGFE